MGVTSIPNCPARKVSNPFSNAPPPPPSSAAWAIARQPEAKGPIQTNMIIAAALIEGATFFALVICMLAL